MRIVFDIDGTIALGFLDDSLDEIKRDYVWVNEFEMRGLLIHALKWHIILPGFIELIKWLDQHGIRFDFFSAGVKERNEILIAELLKLALGESRYLESAPFVKILSRDDLTNHPSIYDNVIKDLSKVSKSDESLENRVLIEDDRSYAHPDQTKNLLLMPFCVGYFAFTNIADDESAIRRANSIFYMSGILLTAIENANISGSSLTDELFHLQHMDCEDGRQELFFEKILYARNQVSAPEREVIFNKIDAIALVGERHLKTINPSLQMLQAHEFFLPNYFPPLPLLHRENSIRRALYVEAISERKNIECSEYRLRKDMRLSFFHIKKTIKSLDEEPLKRQEYQAEYESDVRRLTFFGRNQGRPMEPNFRRRRLFI